MTDLVLGLTLNGPSGHTAVSQSVIQGSRGRRLVYQTRTAPVVTGDIVLSGQGESMCVRS